jgi:hypothetical protein
MSEKGGEGIWNVQEGEGEGEGEGEKERDGFEEMLARDRCRLWGGGAWSRQDEDSHARKVVVQTVRSLVKVRP